MPPTPTRARAAGETCISCRSTSPTTRPTPRPRGWRGGGARARALCVCVCVCVRVRVCVCVCVCVRARRARLRVDGRHCAQVPEAASHIAELAGRRKQRESTAAMVRHAPRKLRRSFGTVEIRVSPPLSLSCEAAACLRAPGADAARAQAATPAGRAALLAHLSAAVTARFLARSAVPPAALLAAQLLAARPRPAVSAGAVSLPRASATARFGAVRQWVVGAGSHLLDAGILGKDVQNGADALAGLGALRSARGGADGALVVDLGAPGATMQLYYASAALLPPFARQAEALLALLAAAPAAPHAAPHAAVRAELPRVRRLLLAEFAYAASADAATDLAASLQELGRAGVLALARPPAPGAGGAHAAGAADAREVRFAGAAGEGAERRAFLLDLFQPLVEGHWGTAAQLPLLLGASGAGGAGGAGGGRRSAKGLAVEVLANLGRMAGAGLLWFPEAANTVTVGAALRVLTDAGVLVLAGADEDAAVALASRDKLAEHLAFLQRMRPAGAAPVPERALARVIAGAPAAAL